VLSKMHQTSSRGDDAEPVVAACNNFCRITFRVCYTMRVCYRFVICMRKLRMLTKFVGRLCPHIRKLHLQFPNSEKILFGFFHRSRGTAVQFQTAFPSGSGCLSGAFNELGSCNKELIHHAWASFFPGFRYFENFPKQKCGFHSFFGRLPHHGLVCLAGNL